MTPISNFQPGISSAQSRADCVVIGGGVIGLSIARELARNHMSVTVIERAACGTESSWAGAGILAPCNPHRRDGVAEWRTHSLELFPSFCAALHAESGIDPEYDRCGELDLHFAEDSRRAAEADLQAAHGRRTPEGRPVYELHSADKARRIEPLLSPDMIAATQCHATAQVRNPRLLQALAAACRRAGVTIHEFTTVHDLLVEGDKVGGVIISPTEASTEGQPTEPAIFRATHTVLCAGAWSSTIGSRLRSLMPVHPVRGQMVLLKAEQRPFTPIISRGKTYLVPRRDGHILLGSTEEPEAGYNKRNTAKAVAKLLETALRLVPSLAEVPVVGTWAGLRPGSPDDQPYLGTVPGLQGLIAATGHFISGLTLAPATAEAVAAMILGRAYSFDLSLCRPGRTR